MRRLTFALTHQIGVHHQSCSRQPRLLVVVVVVALAVAKLLLGLVGRLERHLVFDADASLLSAYCVVIGLVLPNACKNAICRLGPGLWGVELTRLLSGGVALINMERLNVILHPPGQIRLFSQPVLGCAVDG